MKHTLNDPSPRMQLWWLIRQLSHAMHKARARELHKYGNTPQEMAVLSTLNSIGHEATPSEISRWLLLERHTVSRITMRMEQKGLVKRSKDLNQSNLIRIGFTNKGRGVLDQASQRESIRNIMSVITEDECERLAPYLERLLEKALIEAGISHKPLTPTL